MKEGLAWCAAFACLVAVFGAIVGINVWADSSDQAHYNRVAREAKHICGKDSAVAIHVHDNGWWIDATCETSDGRLYPVVIR